MAFTNFWSHVQGAASYAASASASFQNDFHTGGAFQGQAQFQIPEPSKTPPPASKAYINGLVPRPVTQDDIQEANNEECLICLENNEIGSLRVKLPCGHMFCKACISDWLSKHCTCPACRYEVECSDSAYEAERRKRMQKSHKMRIRLDELKSMKIPEIRKMTMQLGIDISDCIDKQEIIDKIKRSDKVDILEGVPVRQIPAHEWESMGVARLRGLLKSYGISDEGALMKNDLRTRLIDSGRVCIIPSSPLASISSPSSFSSSNEGASAKIQASGAGAAQGQMRNEVLMSGRERAADREEKEDLDWVYVPSDPMNIDDGSVHPGLTSYGRTSAPATAASAGSGAGLASGAAATQRTGDFVLGRDLVESMSIRELKSIMEAYGISTERCLERRDLLERMNADSRITLSEE